MTDRTPLVAANWKMNGTLATIRPLLAGIMEGVREDCIAEVAICPPFVYLAELSAMLANTEVRLGAQNVSQQASGAFTGEISVAMLRDFACHYVIVGHSERRHIYGESDNDIAEKFAAYEPVWAIGTGRNASPEQAEEVHEFIRLRLARHDDACAGAVRILYGGSVKADNAENLFSMANVDGGLIGGASLNADDFVSICRATR